jgi:ribosomal protein S24E
MEIKITNQEKNPLLKREELTLEITADSTPSYADLIKQQFKDKDPETIVIQSLTGKFGTHNFKTKVLVYDSKEAKDEFEYVPMKIRKKLEETKKKEEEEKVKAAETPAEPVAEEKPTEAVEEKVEEKPVETPKEEVKDEKPTEEKKE